MQLNPAQLPAHLAKGLRSLYAIHGDEPLLAQEAADAIRGSARERGYTERTSHTVAGAHFDWSAVLAAGGSLSLFADRQVVEIRIPSGKPGKDGSAALQQIGRLASDHTIDPAEGGAGLVRLVLAATVEDDLDTLRRRLAADAARSAAIIAARLGRR